MRFVRPVMVLILVVSLFANAVLFVRYQNRSRVFTLNGQTLTRAQEDSYLEQHYGHDYVAMMTERVLIDQAAKRFGLVPTEAEIDEAFSTKKELDWQFARSLQNQPWLIQDARDGIKQDIEQQRLRVKDTPVTDEEIREEYTTGPALYDTPNKAHCIVAAVLNAAHVDDIRKMMANDASPTEIMQQFPREVYFLGDDNKFVFVQAYGTDMNKDVFSMEPKEVRVLLPGALQQLGAQRLVVRLLDIVPGHKADLNDPKILRRMKLNVALRRARPLPELLSQLWADSKFASADPLDRSYVEQYMFPGQSGGSRPAAR